MEYRYRRIFGLTAEELADEDYELFTMNLKFESMELDKRRLETEHG